MAKMEKSMQAYELLYGYMHCIGRTVYSAGRVSSCREAQDWVEAHKSGQDAAPRVPDQDPVRWCPVRHCHMKRQPPWFDFRPVSAETAEGPS